ncbi:Wall-associated receptor kinase 2 [Camellia lanceoleosa]|uniref:Wall-associated receptor kinase 2 n=1 Tax=Camellia lanceoleosa TaxID=1840588 RepID=A0ACC0HTI8_9ERIC|nr:Wall-associated receptor kinase 2 [Camellia lanceoleosa]
MASWQGMQLKLQPIIMMLVQVQVQVVVMVILSFSAATKAAPPTEADLKNHGCVNHCGNLSIPYPFGVKENCYLSEDFFINCSDSQPYLWHSNLRVTNISLDEGEVGIMNYISRNCYDRLGTPLQSNIYASLNATNFPISSTKNKFTTIGCDTYGYLRIFNNSFALAIGCVSACMNMSYIPDDGSCSGIGCCQTSVPKQLSYIEVDAGSYNNHTNVSDFNPCSYAFVVEEAAFNFSKTYLQNFTEDMVPLVLDWGIRDNETCDEAKRNLTSYACGDHSDCYKAEIGHGYLCKCSKGYKGNAYLSDGCKDIDECADPNLNQCVEKSKCLNTPGDYMCACPKRYHGDGRIYGARCTASRVLVLQIVIFLGLISGIGVLLLIIASWWLYKVQEKRNNKKRKEKFFKRNGGLLLKEKLSSSSCDGSVEKTKLFSSKELEKATDHYNEDRILGQVGQGTVYKGMLSDGSIVAIKKSKIVDEGNVGQFINEVVILSQINHRNVVKLLGCCLETEVPLVVYELVSNGTLFEHIHDANEDFPLPWEMRLRIATEIAGALSYLHSAASVPIYHRDIKSTNILLDDKYRVKVSDFGSSRSVAIDQTHFTTQVQGTFGYLDPEYFQSSQFTEKSDVYSFGVVIVELLTGQKAISSDRSQESRSLATFFIQSMEDNHLFEILDQKIIKEDWREEIVAVAHLAKRCLNLNGKKRPTMKDVAVELEGIRMLRGNTVTQQHYEVFDYNRTDLNEAWDATSTSTGACFDITAASSSDVKPLLLNEP